MFAGALDIMRFDQWSADGGSVVTWHASSASRMKAKEAPVNPVPPSYMQAQHLRGFYEHAERGADYSRVVAVSWDEPGKCDTRAMTHVINAHLRRHDTYHSWFEYTDQGKIVRRTLENPNDIKFTAVKHGQLADEEFHDLLLATPNPLEWDCFSFGLVQHEDHFTFYVSIDHVHTDPMLMAQLYVEIHQMYETLVGGGAPLQLPAPDGYEAYCVRQHDYLAGLTADSPQVRRWIDFADTNEGTLPDFGLPLGDPTKPCGGDILFVQMMDADQTRRFEAACMAAGSRFVGGVFAAAALAQHELTGMEDYYALTPTDMRNSPGEFMTAGWFTGMIPVGVQVDPTSFGATAQSAQKSFDANTDLAEVPFDRVLELAPELRRNERGFPMLAYLDAGLPPLSAVVSSHLEGINAVTYCDGRTPAHICMWVGRFGDETALTVFFPDNVTARESVNSYVEAMKSIYVAVADGIDSVVPLRESA